MVNPELRRHIVALTQPVARLPLRREIVMTLLILAESMIVFIYGGTLLAETAPPNDPLPMLLIFATLLIAYQIPHLLQTIRVWTPEYELVMATGLIATLLMVLKLGAFPEAAFFAAGWIEDLTQALILRESDAIRPVWPLVVFVAYAWGRGRTRAEPMLETGYGMLRFGMLWMLAGLLMNLIAMPPGAAVLERTTLAVGGFVVASLLAIALSRNQSTRAGAAARPIWTWIVVVLLPILVITAATVSVAGVLTREMLDLLLIALAPLFWVLGLLIQVVILVIALIAFILIAPVIWFLERQGIVPMSDFPEIDLSTGPSGVMSDLTRSSIEVADPIRYLIAGLILGGIAWALIRFAFSRRREWAPGQRQQHESLIEWQTEPTTILRRVGSWLRRGRVSWARDPYPDDPRWNGTRRVRRVYRDFLRTNRRYDLTRQPQDTPEEFARRLIRIHDDLGPEIQQITRSYNRARYSGSPVDTDTADRAEQAGHRFDQAIRSLHDA